VLRRCAPWSLLALALAFLGAHTHADDPPAKKDAKPATVKVEKGPLSAGITVKGVVQTEQVAEIAIRLKAWTGPLVVKEVAEHGKAVKAGDPLVRFDTEKLDAALRDARQDRELAELALKQAELELPIIERQAPLDLAAAERDAKQAKDDLKKFVEVDRPQSVQGAEFSLKSAAFQLDFATDELKQLKKMYRDKDLTEETEELILKRYKFGVESAEMQVKRAKVMADQTLKIDLPRREQAAKDAVEKADIALTRAREVQPLTLKQKRLSLAKMKYEDAKAKDRLADLEADRAALVVKAPSDGLVYHGKYARGQWTGAGLSVNGPAQPNEVLLSVVGTSKLTIRAEADEKELPGLKPDVAAKVTPTAFPNQRLAGKVGRVGAAPQGGKFEVLIELTADAPAGLVPGMTCSVRLTTAKKDAALTVPASAVSDDDGDSVVYVLKGGKPTKVPVTLGLTAGDRVEILDGLSAGAEILASKP
jgi:RND family efflux transporter MFP subunit